VSFFGTIQRLASNVSVWFLQNKNIATFLESVAIVYDDALETFRQGMLNSQPLRCDASALPVLSHDRGIRIYPTEPETSQRYRLSRWWQLRRQFGTHVGQMRNLAPFFLPLATTIRIVHATVRAGPVKIATWHTLAPDDTYTVHRADPGNWEWDGLSTAMPAWSDYWVIVYQPTGAFGPQPAWDDANEGWDGVQVWDGLYTAAQIDDMVAAIKEAGAPHMKLRGLIFATDPSSFDPTASVVVDPAGWSTLPGGNWTYVIDNNTGKPTRLPSAVYAYDLAS